MTAFWRNSAARVAAWKGGWPVSALLLLGLMAAVYGPGWMHPPRSDSWPAFYFFHRIDALGGAFKWRALLGHDPLLNVTFRPLAFVIPYALHRVFGSFYPGYNLVHFAFGYGIVLLVLLWARRLCRHRGAALAAVAAFSCLLTHFDLLCWAFHVHILLAFGLFLCAFEAFGLYQRTGRVVWPAAAAAAMLAAMFMYEAFILWPLALLLWVRMPPDRGPRARRAAWMTVPAVYGAYAAVFFLDRMLRSSSGMDTLAVPMLDAGRLVFNLWAAAFGFLYNNAAANLCPVLVLPLSMDENLSLGGVLLSNDYRITALIWIGGTLALAAAAALAWRFRREAPLLRVWAFFGFLALSQQWVLFYFKSMVNPYPYNLLQFRFQFIANACLLLMALPLADKVCMTLRGRRIIIGLCLVVLGVNLIAVRLGMGVLDRQLAPLGRLLDEMRACVASGQVGPKTPMYLDDAVALKLPPLCWNQEMGQRCMSGTYQWIFSRTQIGFFAPARRAAWTVAADRLAVVPLPRARQEDAE